MMLSDYGPSKRKDGTWSCSSILDMCYCDVAHKTRKASQKHSRKLNIRQSRENLSFIGRAFIQGLRDAKK